MAALLLSVQVVPPRIANVPIEVAASAGEMVAHVAVPPVTMTVATPAVVMFGATTATVLI